MDTVQVEPIGEASHERARRASGWVLPLAPWIVAVVLGATMLWIVPRASDSHAASAHNASLSASVAVERSAAVAASASLSSTQAHLSDAMQRVTALKSAAHHRAIVITRLQAQAKRLRAEEARMSAPPVSSPAPIVGGPIRTPVFCIEFPTNPPPGCL